MKVFITCDIEGITTTTLWDEVDITNHADKTAYHAEQMTREVVAACNGAIRAGADYILVNDAHDWGTNIDIKQLPDCCEVIRSWSGHPYDMADGCFRSEGFDAAMFLGCHSPAGHPGNPLSHTMTQNPFYMKLNGEYCSEFSLYSLACVREGVPVVFLQGDKALCEMCKDIHPKLKTLAVKDGCGRATRSIAPNRAIRLTEEMAYEALTQDLTGALAELPKHFVFEVCYKEHWLAKKMGFFPGFEQIDAHTIRTETDDVFDLLTACKFIL